MRRVVALPLLPLGLAAVPALAQTVPQQTAPGALPTRERTFQTFADQPLRLFTANRSARILRHSGGADQAPVAPDLQPP